MQSRTNRLRSAGQRPALSNNANTLSLSATATHNIAARSNTVYHFSPSRTQPPPWRNLAGVGDRRTRVTSLILAGYQIARDRANRAEFLKWAPYPRADHAEKVKAVPADSLLKELGAAIRDKNQARAALAAHVGSGLAKDAFARFRDERGRGATREKYFVTTSEEYTRAREAFKGRQLVALARVTASAYGYAAPAHKEACELLKG